MKCTHRKGFTLIELLVVIAIIGILATVVIGSVNSARTKAYRTTATAQLRTLSQLISVAELESGKNLGSITGSGCTDCTCRGIDLRNSNGICYSTWIVNLADIANAASGYGDGSVAGLYRDPWGSPYLLDENQLEGGNTDCRADGLASAGPDGFAYTNDDIRFHLPPIYECTLPGQTFEQYTDLVTPM